MYLSNYIMMLNVNNPEVRIEITSEMLISAAHDSHSQKYPKVSYKKPPTKVPTMPCLSKITSSVIGKRAVYTNIRLQEFLWRTVLQMLNSSRPIQSKR
jgi:hypothetical protein